MNHERGGYREGGIARQIAAVLSAANRRPALEQLRLHTLVIHGSADPLVPVDGGRATAAAIPGARLVVIDGMGHEQPHAVWAQEMNKEYMYLAEAHEAGDAIAEW